VLLTAGGLVASTVAAHTDADLVAVPADSSRPSR